MWLPPKKKFIKINFKRAKGIRQSITNACILLNFLLTAQLYFQGLGHVMRELTHSREIREKEPTIRKPKNPVISNK